MTFHRLYNLLPFVKSCHCIFLLRSLRELATTDTELNDMAADAIIGLCMGPPRINRTPAAIGMPMILYIKAQKRFCFMVLMVSLLSMMASTSDIRLPFIS